MPYAANGGVRVRDEVAGSGPPLVLHPGFVGGAQDWAGARHVAAPRDRSRLVLLAPCGQGGSDKPRDPAACAAPLASRAVGGPSLAPDPRTWP